MYDSYNSNIESCNGNIVYDSYNGNIVYDFIMVILFMTSNIYYYSLQVSHIICVCKLGKTNRNKNEE